MNLPLPELEYTSDQALGTLTDVYHVEFWPVSVYICAGFSYDGASVPEIAQPFIGCPWDAVMLPGATVHDWLYASHAVPRWIADLVLFYLLFVNGFGFWKSFVVWRAVRRFGRNSWESHGPDENDVAIKQGSIAFF